MSINGLIVWIPTVADNDKEISIHKTLEFSEFNCSKDVNWVNNIATFATKYLTFCVAGS